MIGGRTLRIAVVGTGPAGMYAAEHLVEDRNLDVEVDLYERLPTPWGLIRGGVAPDHPEKKLVIERLFDYFLKHPCVRFFGNVEIGADVHPGELSQWYDAVIYAVGASGDARLGIPGEELPGCWSAREFVAWYNGDPDFSHLDIDLSHRRAVVVGNGNVALDVARILTMPLGQLEKTDMADHALAALRESAVREVAILGRRGNQQAAYHNPELEELAHLEGVEVAVEGDELPGEDEFPDHVADWETRRKLATLRAMSGQRAGGAGKRILMRFLCSPVEVLGEGRVEQLRVVRNRLEADANGRLQARSTGEESLIDTGLVLRSIGYRGTRLAGLPFDDRRGIIGNADGRICDHDGVVPGNYVTGWIKRGPRGIIGTNKKCARNTLRCLVEDIEADRLAPATLGSAEVLEAIQARQPEVVLRPGWLRLDHAERTAGRPQGRPRVKFTEHRDLLAHAARS